MSHPSPYVSHRVVGAASGSSNRALVVNCQDPLKAGRCQIRVVGHMDDEANIPDAKLPWVKVRNTNLSPSMQTSTETHGLIPGAMVHCEAMGENGQDWIVTGTIPNDRKDDNQAIHPATQGKGATDNIHTDQHRKDGTFGFGMPLSQIITNTTTMGARKIRDEISKITRRTAEPVDESINKAQIPEHYGMRTTSKDPEGGTIGVFKHIGADAQAFIQQTIQNKSAIVPNALDALQQLKKVTGNPTSIEAIGPENFSKILSQLSSWFGGGGGSKQQAKKHDCAFLLNTQDQDLTPEEIIQKKLCQLIADAVAKAVNDRQTNNT